MQIITADKEVSDGSAKKLCEAIKTELPILLLSRVDVLDFNEEILSLKGNPYLIIDFIENGWNWDMQNTLIVGKNVSEFKDVCKNEAWDRLDVFVKKNPPLLYFKRELLNKDVIDNIVPICYPCFLPPEPLQTIEQFNNRQLQVIFSWGLSHEYRKELHAEIWKQSGKYGYSVCDNLYYAQKFIDTEINPKKWFTLNIPWYARMPMEEFIKVNGLAKISISIAGAGRNCFRHSESPVNSVMLMWDDKLAWHQRYWIDGYNCIKCEQGKEIETAIEWLNKPDELYKIYCRGVEMVDQFRFEKYIPFLEHLINKA